MRQIFDGIFISVKGSFKIKVCCFFIVIFWCCVFWCKGFSDGCPFFSRKIQIIYQNKCFACHIIGGQSGVVLVFCVAVNQGCQACQLGRCLDFKACFCIVKPGGVHSAAIPGAHSYGGRGDGL